MERFDFHLLILVFILTWGSYFIIGQDWYKAPPLAKIYDFLIVSIRVIGWLFVAVGIVVAHPFVNLFYKLRHARKI